jgi:uncharacterized protein YndB with AHSA1/START domain
MVEQRQKLIVTTPSDLEIVMTRTFDAPRHLVFEAHSKPEHVMHWWARGNPMPVCELDFRSGGKWRFVERTPEGEEYAFRGEYREIVRPERIVMSFEWEGMPGHISVDTLTFEERDGVTTLTSRTLFDSVEDRNGMLESGMEEGANQSMEALAEYLKTMRR